jgi:DNA topoisomerase VI subunit B
MRLAIIGWGSLIWNPETLNFIGEWNPQGPILPIEFSRISANERLTLVIDEANGVPIQTLYALAATASLEEAIENLTAREGTNSRGIGHVRNSDQPQSRVEKAILEWVVNNGFDAAIWTALSSNFEHKTGKPYSVENALAYVDSLEGSIKTIALEYISKAPAAVQTPFRARFEKTLCGK